MTGVGPTSAAGIRAGSRPTSPTASSHGCPLEGDHGTRADRAASGAPSRPRAGSHLRSQHSDLGKRLGRARRCRPRSASGRWSGSASTARRVPGRGRRRRLADDDVVEVIWMSERQDGEVEQGVALGRLGPVEDAGDLVTVDEDVVDLQVAVNEHGVHGRSAVSASRRFRVITSPGRTSLAISHSHSSSSREARSSTLRPRHGGSGGRATSGQRHPPQPTPPTTRSTAPEVAECYSRKRGEGERGGSANEPPESEPAPWPSPPPRRRGGSDQRRS